MTADEMFKELGYEKIFETEISMKYRSKFEDTSYIVIDKMIGCYFHFDYRTVPMLAEEIIKAAVKKIEEKGW